MWLQTSFPYIVYHLVSESLKRLSDVPRALLNYFCRHLNATSQKRHQLKESAIFRVLEPRFYEDAVFCLKLEVFWEIVYDDNLRKVSSQL